MDTEAIVIISVVGFIVGLFIWHEIIRSAVSSALKKQNQQQLEFLRQQTRLLSELLLKNGVQEERVADILDMDKPYLLTKTSEKMKEEPWKPEHR